MDVRSIVGFMIYGCLVAPVLAGEPDFNLEVTAVARGYVFSNLPRFAGPVSSEECNRAKVSLEQLKRPVWNEIQAAIGYPRQDEIAIYADCVAAE